MQGYYLNPEKTAEVFKTTKGKFIVPTRLENLFGRSELLAQFCVFGHGMDQPAVLATLSEVGQNIDEQALLAQLEALVTEIKAEVPPYERVHQLTVTPEWNIENGLLTPTMKLKRNQIVQAYGGTAADSGSAGKVVLM